MYPPPSFRGRMRILGGWFRVQGVYGVGFLGCRVHMLGLDLHFLELFWLLAGFPTAVYLPRIIFVGLSMVPGLFG